MTDFKLELEAIAEPVVSTIEEVVAKIVEESIVMWHDIENNSTLENPLVVMVRSKETNHAPHRVEITQADVGKYINYGWTKE